MWKRGCRFAPHWSNSQNQKYSGRHLEAVLLHLLSLQPDASQQGEISWLWGAPWWSPWSNSWLCQTLRTACLTFPIHIHGAGEYGGLKRKNHSFSFQLVWPQPLLSNLQVTSLRTSGADNPFPLELVAGKQQRAEKGKQGCSLVPLIWREQLHRHPERKLQYPCLSLSTYKVAIKFTIDALKSCCEV